MNPQKNKGSAYERTIVAFLRQCGFRVDRTRAGWSDDRGDIHGVSNAAGKQFVMECKNHRTTNLAGWLSELRTECVNAGTDVGAVVHKRVGSTEGENQYATLPLGMLVLLLKEAGYK
jgi:hypothetical protein